MTDLHDLLEQDGRQWRDGFVAPDLDAMLAEVTRSQRSRARWAWPILAAVLLLAVPLVTLLLRPDSRHASPGGTSSPASSSSPAPKPGSRLLGLVPWTGVAVSQGQDGRSVSVWVDIDRTPNWCMTTLLPVLQASAVEQPSRITIEVRAYEPPGYQPPTVAPGTVLGCAGVGHRPVPLLVHLSAPIAGRSLLDAATGQSHALQQAAQMPSVTRLPAGYVDAGSSPDLGQSSPEGDLQFGAPRFNASHTYRNGNNLLALVRYQNNPPASFLQVQATGTVLGHPAQLGYGYHSPAWVCADWSASGYSWQFCSYGIGAYAPLSFPELLAAANSLR
jgi:hypothetical protein